MPKKVGCQHCRKVARYQLAHDHEVPDDYTECGHCGASELAVYYTVRTEQHTKAKPVH